MPAPALAARTTVSDPANAPTAAKTIAQKSVAYGIAGERVDGNDVLASYLATRDAVERAHRGGQADQLWRDAGEGLEALHREREVRAALVAGERVNLVDHHRAHLLERGPRAGGGEIEE